MAILVGRLGIGRDESRPYGGVFGGEQRVVIFAPPPTRQIFPIRDAVGAQFIAPLLVREALRARGDSGAAIVPRARSRCAFDSALRS